MSPDYDTYPAGSYAVFFHDHEGRVFSTHSLDRASDRWWDGSKIVSTDFVDELVKSSNSPLLRMHPDVRNDS